MVVIKSKYFILRPFRKEDAVSFAENTNNKVISYNTAHNPYPYTLEDAKKWIRKILKENRKKKPTRIEFAIETDGKTVGRIGLGEIETHKAVIGYWLGKRYWGKGIMTKAIKLVTNFGFEKLKLRRIYAHVFPFNKASMRILEKNGYKLEGILRKEVKKGNKLIDTHLFAKVK